MDRDDDDGDAAPASVLERTDDAESLPEVQPESQPQPQPESQPQPPQPKQKKHGRVHKREQELYGLVTPVFLPLLDAREATTPAKKKPASASASPAPRDAGTPPTDMPAAASDPIKKRRSSSIKKKSALRHSTAPRNRKRVSLVIDDHVVLPSDSIQEPALTSPGSDSTSATTSTASLDDLIDPRLTSDAPVFIEHSDALHHSLPPTTTSPAKSSAPSLSSPAKSSAPPLPTPARHSPPTSPTRGAVPYAPPSYATRSFLDPPPDHMHIDDLPSAAGPAPIYPASLDNDPEDQFASTAVERADEGFQTYVGGISGSGVDDVNQVGSVGYPSSLGASYLESYMQGRPLSVRMAAAEGEGNANELRKLRSLEERRKQREASEANAKRADDEEEWNAPAARGKDADDDDFMGSMDDF